MEPWYYHLIFLLKEWTLAISVLVCTSLFVTLTRSILKRVGHNGKWDFIHQLAPSISNVLYIIGLKLAVEFLPLTGRVDIWLDGLIYVLSVIIYLRLIQRAALLGIEWSALKRNKVDILQHGFLPLLRNIITLFIFFTAGIMILKHFNYDVMSLITALGVGSLAVGLAAKDTLSNMISGFILIIDQNLKPGDRINLGGNQGDVTEIGLRSTQIRLGDGNTLIVPNSDLVNTKILNLSIPSRSSSCTVTIRVPFSVSYPKIKSTSLSILKNLPQVAQDRPQWVNLNSLADGNQLIQIGFWVSDMADSGSATSDFNERLLSALQNEKIPLLAPPAS